MAFLAGRALYDQIQIVLQRFSRGIGPDQGSLELSVSSRNRNCDLFLRIGVELRRLILKSKQRVGGERPTVAGMSTRPKPSDISGIAPTSGGVYWSLMGVAPLISIALTRAALGVAMPPAVVRN